MDLKDFISNTVKEVTQGIGDAAKLTGKKVGLYSPGKSDQRHIEFDVAVTVNDKKQRDGSLGIQVLSLGVGGKKSSETINTTVSRIKFGIRISDTKSIS